MRLIKAANGHSFILDPVMQSEELTKIKMHGSSKLGRNLKMLNRTTKHKIQRAAAALSEATFDDNEFPKVPRLAPEDDMSYRST